MSDDNIYSIEDLSQEFHDKFGEEANGIKPQQIPIEEPSEEVGAQHDDKTEEYYPYDVSLKTTLKKVREASLDLENDEVLTLSLDDNYSDIQKFIEFFEKTGLMDNSAKALKALKDILAENDLSDNYDDYLSLLRDDLRGFGVLEQYLSNPDVSSVMVNSYNQIYVNYRGKRVLADTHFSSEDHFEAIVKRRLPEDYSEKESFEYGNFNVLILSRPIYDGYFLSFKRKYGYNHSDHLEFSKKQVEIIREYLEKNKRIAVCHELSGMQRLFIDGFADVVADKNLVAEISTGEPFIFEDSTQFYMENILEFNACLGDIMTAGFDYVFAYDISPDQILPDMFADSCIVFMRSRLNRKVLDLLKENFDLIIGFKDNSSGGEQVEAIYQVSDDRVAKLF